MFGEYWNYCQISDGVLYYTSLRPTENEVHSMNKTFKIVFNKARGALMVANEITGSVQKKGAKILVVSAAALVAAAPQAETISQGQLLTGVTKVFNGVEVTATNTSKTSGSAFFIEEGADITINNSIFQNNIAAGKKVGGAIWLYGNYNQLKQDATKKDDYTTSKLTLNNVSFTNNQAEWGGAMYIYPKSETAMNNGSFIGNKASCTEDAYGGAVMFKGGTATFKDVLFQNNTAESKKGGAFGGALLVDITKNSDENNNPFEYLGDVTFKITKDMAYTGNNVIANNSDASDTYGYWAYTSGGFLFLDRRSKGTFDIDKGATLTLGESNATGHMDSIASAIPQVSDSPKSTLIKKGAGTLLVNSSMDYFFGNLFVEDGTMKLTKDQTSKATITVNGGVLSYSGALTLQDFSVQNKYFLVGSLLVNNGTVSAKTLKLEGSTASADKPSVTVAGGSLSVEDLLVGNGSFGITGGTVTVSNNISRDTTGRLSIKSGVLNAQSSVLFKNFGEITQALNTDVFDIAALTGGTLNVSDFTGTYTLAQLAELEKLTGQTKVTFINGILDDADATLDKVVEASANAAGSSVTATADSDGIIGIDNGNNSSVGSIVVNDNNRASEFNLKGGKLTLAGNSSTPEIISGNISDDFAINVSGGSNLVLGFDASSSGAISHPININDGILSIDAGTFDLNTVKLEETGHLTAVNESHTNIGTLSGKGIVSIGQADGSGASMTIGELAMTAGTIYVDPEYGHSTLQIDSLADDTLNTNIIAGHGALVTIGADADTAKSAVAKLDNFDAVQSVFYIASPITIGTGGSIDISSELLTSDSSAVSTRSPRGVTVNSNSALVVDQATIGSSPVFTGTDITFNGGRLGIVNANVGTITLTDGTVSELTNQAISVDNPFIEATVDGNTVVNTMSAEGGLGALASTGIQAMTRRADTVLAQTIADRTSLDQELAVGTNLWVDVTGERYEADKLDNGGEFKSDMGYGAFGADFAVTQDITAGAAFQYGKGTLRSGVSSIKNSIDSYGVTAYGAMKFGDSKVVAEASYIKNENDITSSQTALNQSVDSEIYSVGVRGQHRFTAGNFQFVPSVGVRVSRLNTDAMQVGAVNIKKQEQTLVQVPIALRVNGFEQNVSGWSVAPSFKVAYVPTFGDKEISVLGADQTVIDTSPVQSDFGIRAQNGNLMVNANMMLGGGKDGTSSVGGKVGLKYVF